MFRRHVAMGDPQAPFATVLEILDAHALLDGSGKLRADVQLVSMGDHFDWGRPADRRRATDDALALVAWLSAHAPEQVVMLAGNHDLARVCELWPFTDDAAFEAAHAEAAALYRAGVHGPETRGAGPLPLPPSPWRGAAASTSPDRAGSDAAAEFAKKYPFVPDPECLARDYSCFSTEQQRQVIELLRGKRLRLAHEHRGLLLVHAGVTLDDFALVSKSAPADAAEASLLLNAFFDARVDRWDGVSAFDLSPLHQPGTAATGEARGILYHRPAMPIEGDARFDGPPRRRFDPRRLPTHFPQAIGHVRDDKCRAELKSWADGSKPRDGLIRWLRVAAETVTYAHGAAKDATMYLLDAGMNYVPHGQRYELFDLDARAGF